MIHSRHHHFIICRTSVFPPQSPRDKSIDTFPSRTPPGSSCASKHLLGTCPGWVRMPRGAALLTGHLLLPVRPELLPQLSLPLRPPLAPASSSVPTSHPYSPVPHSPAQWLDVSRASRSEYHRGSDYGNVPSHPAGGWSPRSRSQKVRLPLPPPSVCYRWTPHWCVLIRPFPCVPACVRISSSCLTDQTHGHQVGKGSGWAEGGDWRGHWSVLGRSVVSDSLWPHELFAARPLCPWSFSGKDTETGCHSLLQGIFPAQGAAPSLLSPHQQADSLPPAPPGKPTLLTYV